MNDISRIHIAKVPYEIEPDAKRELDAYMKELAAYARDEELLQDIEIRITEILANRNVMKGTVIVTADVAAVMAQLGKPEDFMGETDEPPIDATAYDKRKLYRDETDAIVGGVMSGLARYGKADPLWLRLIFAVLVVVTGGSILILYLLLWIIMPPARSAAEKLQMQGRPVTLASIKELNRTDSLTGDGRNIAHTIRRVGLAIAGGLLCIAVVGALVATVVGAYITIGYVNNLNNLIGSPRMVYLALAFAICCGLLLSALFSIGAYAAFKQRMPRRLVVSTIVIVILGCLSFVAAAGAFYFNEREGRELVARNTTQQDLALPINFDYIKSLEVTSRNYTMAINYVVSTKKDIVFESYNGLGKPSLVVKDGRLIVVAEAVDNGGRYFPNGRVTIYGPKLDNINIKEGNVSYTNGGGNLMIDGGQDAYIRIDGGTYMGITTKLDTGATLSASEATVEQLVADIRSGSSLNLGTVKTLAVSVPESCPSGRLTNINVDGVSGQFTLNGAAQPLRNQENTCLQVTYQPNSI